MARKDKQQQPAQREQDDMEKGPGPARDPDVENPGDEPGKKSNRGDQQKEMPSQGDPDEMDEPGK
jgi:hypothetical protein